ncbi:MAG: hypothetical protein HY211_05415 [Candidatus Omnitrophica bacterium]|nr:hypothetical protein [Candidatus Omnitrophota bacterium]
MSGFSLTPVQRQILKFFQQHPQAVETVRGIASWLGHEAKVVEEALKELVGRRWLATDETSAVRGYALTGDRRMLTQIQEALEGS